MDYFNLLSPTVGDIKCVASAAADKEIGNVAIEIKSLPNVLLVFADFVCLEMADMSCVRRGCEVLVD